MLTEEQVAEYEEGIKEKNEKRTNINVDTKMEAGMVLKGFL